MISHRQRPTKFNTEDFLPATASSVLLVCIQSDNPEDVSLDFLHEKFWIFGHIQKILIFERGPIIKSFIEFDNSKYAEEARVGVWKIKEPHHRIKCYPSNLPTIQINHENAMCAKDYNAPPPLLNSKSLEFPDLIMAKKPMPELSNITGSTQTISSNESPSETPDRDVEEDHSSHKDSVEEELERTLKLLNDETTENLNEEKEPQSATLLPRNFSNQMNRGPPLKSMSLPVDVAVGKTCQTQSWANFGDENMMLQQFDDDMEIMSILSQGLPEKTSPVLYVKGLNTGKTTLEQVYNLFSNYGNIVKVLYSPAKNNVALVEYDSCETAALAKHYVHNLPLFSGQLKVFFSNHETIKFKHSLAPNEYFIGTGKTNRFRESRPLSINPPSPILHVSNLVPEACNPAAILPLFLPYGDIIAYKFLHEGTVKHMCLLKFAFIEQAINALVSLHNYYLIGRNMQISFTRSKL